MAYNTTIIGQMIQIISRLEFQSIVKKHKGDHKVTKLRCWDQFIHGLLAQVSGRHSLRETVSSLSLLYNKLYHLGSRPVCRSTLSDANNKRSPEIYKELFFSLLKRTQALAPKYKLKLNRKLYLLDATTIDLCLSLFPWAQFRKTKAGVRLHTLLDSDGILPVFLTLTDGKGHEAKQVKDMPIPKGSYLAIDRGYHDFKQYKAFTDNDIRFVTRIKTNARYQKLKTVAGPANEAVLNDEIIQFSGYQTKKKCPYPLRKICYFDKEQNREITFLTNDLEADAAIIADIYKARWEIELFFKTIKQNLKIKHFYGTSANAVLTQIWISMITYLLLSYLKFKNKSTLSIQALARTIQVNLFERKSIKTLFNKNLYKPPNRLNDLQVCLFNF
jgi:putative transposase